MGLKMRQGLAGAGFIPFGWAQDRRLPEVNRRTKEPLPMNRRGKEPLFLTFSPQAGRRNQSSNAILRFWGSMRQFFGGNLSPALSPLAGRESRNSG
jgi:hypothetical protein